MAATKDRRKRELARIPADDARAAFGDVLDRAFKGERIVITRHGKPSAALIPVGDLEKLEGASQ